jgi:hypothetical protein
MKLSILIILVFASVSHAQFHQWVPGTPRPEGLGIWPEPEVWKTMNDGQKAQIILRNQYGILGPMTKCNGELSLKKLQEIRQAELKQQQEYLKVIMAMSKGKQSKQPMTQAKIAHQTPIFPASVTKAPEPVLPREVVDFSTRIMEKPNR